MRLRNLLRFNPYLGESDPDLTQETQDFLDVVLDTDCMRIAHGYLIQWGERISFKMIGCRVKHTWNHDIPLGLAPATDEEWRTDVTLYWFGRYSRAESSEVLDSSGFEHVFQGQIRENRVDVIGFHNWVQMYQEEDRAIFQYGEGDANCGVAPTKQSFPFFKQKYMYMFISNFILTTCRTIWLA